MNYESTRAKSEKLSSAQAIVKGLSPEGGLFVPENIPQLTLDELKNLCTLDYHGRAVAVLGKFLTDFTADEIETAVKNAYQNEKFKDNIPAPVTVLSADTFILELWQGPTAAFKDMALQIMPHLMQISRAKIGENATTLILVATSGDTGKAALEGFKDVEGIKIMVFYPKDGVSAMQKLQMATQEGANVNVMAVEGNFDDCQSKVKEIFADKAMAEELLEADVKLSSANSINWGRLVPQIVYYVSAYCDLAAEEKIAMGETINVVVPTGNFGNILAAYYAKIMGVPIGKLISASNQNNVLADFIKTGIYDRRRTFYKTTSPSMDILISSNLERFLYEICMRDDSRVKELMESLAAEEFYKLSKPEFEKVKALFEAGYATDEEAAQTLKKVFDEYSYLLDTHTAVAYKIYEDYKKSSGDSTKTLVVSTASPFKFAADVLDALGENAAEEDFVKLELLAEKSGAEIPDSLGLLKQKEVKFKESCTVAEAKQKVMDFAKK